jgi:hypothetical protein
MAARFLSLNINLDKVDMKRVYKGQKGTYLNVRLVLQDSVDSYGNIGFLVQETTSEEYKAGVRLPICGSVKERIITPAQSSQPVQVAQPVQPVKQQQAFQAEVFDSNDLPF